MEYKRQFINKRVPKHKRAEQEDKVKPNKTVNMKQILDMYLQDTFTEEDQKYIATAIDTGAISAHDIKENFVRFMLDKFSGEQLWEYLHEYYDNGLTHKQNYSLFIKHFCPDSHVNKG